MKENIIHGILIFLIIAGFVVAIICGIIMTGRGLINIDMTRTRLIITYWKTVVVGIVSVLISYGSLSILAKT